MKLASYATQEDNLRIYSETSDFIDSSFALDRKRIINSAAFRRLEYKTQVLVNNFGDHYRTRLTHSLEVSQISRTISRALSLNENLAEVIALSHDLGHPPFGHAGEEGLNKASMEYCGFNHNLHAIKIITELEDSSIEFKGLNLTSATLEGIIKHNGPQKDNDTTISSKILKSFNIPLTRNANLEAQAAAIADDIAYCNHDLDDAIRGNFISLTDLSAIPSVDKIFYEVKRKNPEIDEAMIVKEAIRRLSNKMISDIITNSISIIKSNNIKSITDVFESKTPLIQFSNDTENLKNSLKSFLLERYYRHYLVNRITSKAKKVVQEIFDKFYESPSCLPLKWQKKCEKNNKAEVIVNYIAGMTDRYAIEEYSNLFDLKML
jgi:dGTPase